MRNNYPRGLQRWCWLLGLLLVQLAARAQSGPYGSEWIVPSQTYYKIKVTQDGIYRLDYNYLTRAGISGVNPQRLQLWRRGREVARYIGGSRTQLDATTYVEFYGQRNDGKLDRDMYKAAEHQPHQLYSLFTDTAAYFLTWSATTNGRDMAEPVTSAGSNHLNWVNEDQSLFTYDYQYGQTNDQLAFLPWADTGEGFLAGFIGRRDYNQPDANEAWNFTVDGVDWVTSTGATPQLEIVLVGSNKASHVTNISVGPDGGASRPLATVRYPDYSVQKYTFPIQRTDIGSNGKVRVYVGVENAAANPRDRFRVAYARVRSPQLPQWIAGASRFAFLSDSTLTGPAYYDLSNAPATLLGYDVTDPNNVQRVAGLALSGTRRGYGFPTANGRTRRLLLADGAQALQPDPAQRVRFRVFNPAQAGYVIVTSKALMQPAGAVTNPVRAYATYRASTAGGRYDTLVVTSDLLYDQFHYGERSPLAVKHFADYLLSAPRPNRYLFLLGRGVLITEGVAGTFFRQADAAQRAQLPPDLVPASTRGASDIFFTADWQRDSFVPRIPTGRLAARTPQQVVDYLRKIQEHETAGVQPWRKNILHLAGGQSTQEFTQFQGYMRDFQRRAEAPLFGAAVENIYNTNLGGATVFVDIAPQVNRGLSLITYFGHASPQYLNLMPTDILNPSSGYANRGKYPVWVALGCAVGNAMTGASSLGEDWTLVANKGAIGFLASSDFTIDSQAYEQGVRLYSDLFNDPQWYGKSVAAVQAEVNRQLMAILPQSNPNADQNYRYFVSMMMNTVWQGDPALALYAPEKPDYQFTANTTPVSVVSVDGRPVLANSTSFGLRLQLSNPGKVIRTPLQVTVARQIGTSPATVQTFTLPFFRRDTTVTLTLANANGVNVFGRNVFTVKLDDPNVIDELNENNNTATTDFNFLNGGVSILNPSEFAIVGKTNVRLVAQSNLLQSQPVGFEFELDTIPTFNSPLRRTTAVQALDVAEWRPGLPTPSAGRDSVVYYWRVRFAASTGLDQSWATSSFRLISNSPGGWSQSHYGQMAANDKQKLVQQTPSGRWEFTDRTRAVQLKTEGAPTDAGTFQLAYGITVDNLPVRVDNCGLFLGGATLEQPNIMAAVFDGRNLRQLNSIPGGPYPLCGEVGTNTYFHFASADRNNRADNFNAPARQQQFLRFLQNVPNGAYVALVSINRVNFSTLDPQVKQALSAMGSQLINAAQDGDPLVMLLHKGFPNDRQEATFSPGSSTPRAQQVVTLSGTVRTREGAGTVASTRIGPALQWQTLYHTVKLPDASDSYTLRLVGYDRSNTRTVLNANVTSRNFSLASISAQQYPYLQLEADLRDTTNLTPPQLKQWLITYRGVAEGVVRRDHPSIPAGAYSPATLSAAAASSGYVSVPVYFENVSSNDFSGKTRALITVRETRNGGIRDTFSIRSTGARLPGADSTAFFNFARVDVRRYAGEVTIQVDANSRQLPELITYNNTLNLSFTAPSVTVPPVLDVAFDGMHILNGDIVSASPEILVEVRYEDKRRPIRDPSRVQVYLTRPGSSIPQQIDMNNQTLIRFVSDTVAGRFRVYYTPGTLPDGVYKLEAQARDMADNPVAAQRFAVTFEVINQASITNVFPYPNPVTSKARFVFTLTGSTPPRNMKIQILTLSGKVVREIMQAELGNVRVGNNITDYAWDGTDQYGDQLANGTYLYRVVLDDPEGDYKHRRTAADQAFKKGWGKLVLMR